MKKVLLLFSFSLTYLSVSAQFDNDANFMRIRPGVNNSQLDNATGNGMYGVTYLDPNTGLPQHHAALLTFHSGGSTGPFQLEASYWGLLRFRNKTDNANWQDWKTIWHSGNFSPATFMSGVVNVWSNDAAGAQRFFFYHDASAPSTTHIKGFGARPLVFRNGADLDVMEIANTGNVGIGTVPHASHKLAVAGSVIATKIKVSNQPWADFVFDDAYRLPSIPEVEAFIKTHRRLPEIPSAAEVQADGIDLGDMNKKLLQKVEELTLYLIDQHKKIETLQAEVELLKKNK